MEDTKKIAVRNNDGKEIGTFNISVDSNIAKRYEESLKKLKKISAPLWYISITADGRAVNKSGKRILSTAENKIYALFDEIIGYGGAYKAFFSEVRPFASVKGRFYCDQCLELVKQCINTKIGGK